MKALLLPVVILLLVTHSLRAQVEPDSVQLRSLQALESNGNTRIAVQWDQKSGTPASIRFETPVRFDSDPSLSVHSLVNEVKGMLKFRDTMDELLQTTVREMKGVHYVRLIQRYKGVRVLGGEYVFAVRDGGFVQSGLGNFFSGIEIETTPGLSALRALSRALQNPPAGVTLKDSLLRSELVILLKNRNVVLGWQLEISVQGGDGSWTYLVGANDGEILEKCGSQLEYRVPEPWANVYLRHPNLDGNYTNLILQRTAMNGYLQGTYVDVRNSVTQRAYSADMNFQYQPSDTHFDEANLYYHVDKFRVNYWNEIGFNSFTQIIANAHQNYDANGQYEPNQAYYNLTTKQINFGDGVYSGYNSFAKEDKMIYHEYTHAVTDFVAGLSDATNGGDNETFGIHEGNSDFFSGSYTGRTLIGDYAMAGWTIFQRNMTNPRIQNYTQYNDPLKYELYNQPYHEKHLGGELWSAALWDMRTNSFIGQWAAEEDVFRGLFGLTQVTSFLQYRQAIINADINYHGGAHRKHIEHLFYVRGIGNDSMNVSISGPSTVFHPEKGVTSQYTWTANVTGGTSPFSFAWKKNGSPVGTNSSTYTESYSFNGWDCGSYQFTLSVDVTDANGSDNASKTVTAWNSCGGAIAAPGESPVLVLPTEFSIGQNYPNPFNPETEISFALPEPSSVRVTVSDMLGREIMTLVDREYSAGYQKVTWKGTDGSGNKVGSGVYFYRIVATGQSGKQFAKVMKMLLTK